jgi:hypothetical protein
MLPTKELEIIIKGESAKNIVSFYHHHGTALAR